MMQSDSTSITQQNVPVVLRDGTVLRAIVIRPADDIPAPVILIRTPYPPESAVRYEIDTLDLAKRRFVLVVVSARGTGASEGTFEPWFHDAMDGADTIQWCAEQRWSSGRIASLGSSYVAHTQLFAAGSGHPALRAMALRVVPGDPYDVTYSNGAMNLGSSLFWALGMASAEIARRHARGEDVAAAQMEWLSTMRQFPQILRTMPLTDIPVLDEYFPIWRAWLEHPVPDEYWEQRMIAVRPSVPSITVAGWHDIFLNGGLREFAKEPRHLASRLIIGPWSHAASSSALGDIDYGYDASPQAVGLDTELIAFVATHLSDEAMTDEGPAVKAFLTGANRWAEFDTWPPTGADDLCLYLGPGTLTTTASLDDESWSEFKYDPRDPVPTLGGAILTTVGDSARMSGSIDQRDLDDRADIVRFLTNSLVADLEVVGPVRLVLHAATSAVDTDWTARLIDVHPDGTAYNLTDGIVRAQFRDPAHPQLLRPGTPHEFVVDLGAIGHVFRQGHRVRLDVSSSNFPRYDRNPGTGETSLTAHESNAVIGDQTIFHDGIRPSRLFLPITSSAPKL